MSDSNDNAQEFRQDKIADPYEKKQNDNLVLISLLLGIFGISIIGFILIIIARRKGATGPLSTLSFIINLLGVCAVVMIIAAVIFSRYKPTSWLRPRRQTVYSYLSNRDHFGCIYSRCIKGAPERRL